MLEDVDDKSLLVKVDHSWEGGSIVGSSLISGFMSSSGSRKSSKFLLREL